MPRSSLKSNKLKIWKRVVLPILAGLVVAGFFAFANPTLKTSVTAPIQNGLVGYWNMDSSDIYGFTLYDKSGNGNNGTIYGATTTTGKIKQALSFDGVDDYVDCGNATSLDITDEITIEAWVYPNVVNIWQRAVSEGEYNTEWIFGITKTGKVDITIYDVDTVYHTIYGDTTMTTGIWQHIAATYSKSQGKANVYLNGVIDRTPYSLSKDIENSGHPVRIGRSGLGYYFDGLIDEVRIYNRALSAEEVLQNYNASKRTYIDTSLKDRWTDGLIGYWTFDGPDIQGVNATATDVSGNGNDGTIYGAHTTPGKVGQALSFDGVDDYVDCGSGASLDITQAITIEAWVKLNSVKIQDIVGKGVGGTYMPYDLVLDSDGTIYYLESPGGSIWGTLIHPPNALSVGIWYHIVGTNDLSTARLYLNGTEIGSDTTPVVTKMTNTLVVDIGAAGGTRFFNGLIDEVRIYNRALSSEEIKEHYQGGMRRMEIKSTEIQEK